MEQEPHTILTTTKRVSEKDARRVKWWWQHFSVVLPGWQRRDVIR